MGQNRSQTKFVAKLKSTRCEIIVLTAGYEHISDSIFVLEIVGVYLVAVVI